MPNPPLVLESDGQSGRVRESGWRLVFVGAYVGLIGSLFTGVYYPFTVSEDRSWLIVVPFVAAHLALGASWRRNWAFALPPAIAIIGVLAARANHNPWVELEVIVAVPTAMVLIALGRLLAWVVRHGTDGRLVTLGVPALLFVVAAGPLAEAARESYHLITGPRLPTALAEQLPLAENTLNTLCGDPGKPPSADRTAINAEARALVQQTRIHGDQVVHTTYFGQTRTPANTTT